MYSVLSSYVTVVARETEALASGIRRCTIRKRSGHTGGMVPQEGANADEDDTAVPPPSKGDDVTWPGRVPARRRTRRRTRGRGQLAGNIARRAGGLAGPRRMAVGRWPSEDGVPGRADLVRSTLRRSISRKGFRPETVLPGNGSLCLLPVVHPSASVVNRTTCPRKALPPRHPPRRRPRPRSPTMALPPWWACPTRLTPRRTAWHEGPHR